MQYALFLHETKSKTAYTNLLKEPFLLVTNFISPLLQGLFGIPLQTSINLVTITLAVKTCHDCELVDQNDFENSTERGEERGEIGCLQFVARASSSILFLQDAQLLLCPSWFDEAKYVHKTMPILLINILQTLTSDPNSGRQR